jgi:Nitrile hydratase beta subunit
MVGLLLLGPPEIRCSWPGVEALGSETINKLSYYERWIVAFANILVRKQILTPTELALKMLEVQGRWPSE